MGNAHNAIATIKPFMNAEDLPSDSDKLIAMTSLKNDLQINKPEGLHELLINPKYQESVSARIIEFSSSESLVFHALDMLLTICTF